MFIQSNWCPPSYDNANRSTTNTVTQSVLCPPHSSQRPFTMPQRTVETEFDPNAYYAAINHLSGVHCRRKIMNDGGFRPEESEFMFPTSACSDPPRMKRLKLGDTITGPLSPGQSNTKHAELMAAAQSFISSQNSPSRTMKSCNNTSISQRRCSSPTKLPRFSSYCQEPSQPPSRQCPGKTSLHKKTCSPLKSSEYPSLSSYNQNSFTCSSHGSSSACTYQPFSQPDSAWSSPDVPLSYDEDWRN